jgi:hypothetical protein
MAKNKTRTLVVIHPDGTKEQILHTGDLLRKLYEIIGTDCVTRTEVKYEGKKRYVWLSDNGFAERKPLNPHIRPLAEAYWGRPCQEFVGIGVVEIPYSG